MVVVPLPKRLGPAASAWITDVDFRVLLHELAAQVLVVLFQLRQPGLCTYYVTTLDSPLIPPRLFRRNSSQLHLRTPSSRSRHIWRPRSATLLPLLSHALLCGNLDLGVRVFLCLLVPASFAVDPQ